MDDAELKQRIAKAKASLGRRLVILGHHYQREEVIEFADFRGDSFALSKIAGEQRDARFIVFCGVYFMAEAARILAKKEQQVFIPEPSAGCPMADMASIDDVEDAWNELAKITDIKRIVPVAYMNTSASIKAFCGKNGGIICTSSNAPRALEWAFARGDKVFFFPDENLGRNSAKKLGIPRQEVALWSADLGTYALKNLRAILWPGFCHVHTHFKMEHVLSARNLYPGCKVIVHPECREDVVTASDESASTEGICRYVEKQPKGTTIVIGTEINLVARLANEHPDKRIVTLNRSLCPNMFKISLKNLCAVLEGLVAGEPFNEVTLPDELTKSARVALDRMLKL